MSIYDGAVIVVLVPGRCGPALGVLAKPAERAKELAGYVQDSEMGYVACPGKNQTSTFIFSNNS